MSVSILKTGLVKASGEIGANLFKFVPKSHNATTYNAYQFDLSENLVANQTYTIQFWNVDISHSEKTASNLRLDVYWGGGSTRLFGFGGAYFTDGHADYLEYSFTVTSSQASGSGSSNLWLNIYNSPSYVAGTMNLEIGKWKLEKGSIPTDWCPNVNDAIFVGSKSGFNEELGNASITSGYINSTEFIEY